MNGESYGPIVDVAERRMKRRHELQAELGAAGLASYWLPYVACAGRDPELFFEGNTNTAKAICDDCPVREECLASELYKPSSYGVFGGMTARERVAHRRRLSRTG